MSKAKLKTNQELVSTGRDNRVTGFKMPDFQYTAMGRLIIYRLIHDRDVKIVITSSGTTTGTGKTTFAIILARWVNMIANEIYGLDTAWKAKEFSFMDVWDYLNKYKNADPGDVLLTDELEYLADKRRSMSNQNVFFSQAWGMLRYKNVVTIGTAPGMHSLDKRIPENADIWINVITTGRANTYYLTVDDFSGEPIEQRFKINGYKETLLWIPLPESDPDYRYMKGLKDDIGVPGIDDNEREIFDESDINDAQRTIKRQIAIDLLKRQEDLGLTQAEIGDIVGYSQQNIYKIKREELDR